MKNLVSFLFLISTALCFCSFASNEVNRQDSSNLICIDEQPIESLNSVELKNIYFSVSSIVRFNWEKGKFNWSRPSQQRLSNTTLIFKSGGQFTLTFPWDAYSRKTLNGEFWDNGNNTITFYASQSTSSGVGGTHLIISGTLYVKNGKPYAEVHYGSGSHMSAEINNQKFKHRASKAYSAVVRLKQ